jgi:hypothetical protein
LQAKADSIDSPSDETSNRKPGDAASIVSLDQEMTRVQLVLARAMFFEGWADFFSGLLAEPARRSSFFEEAERAFAQLLEVSTEDKLDLGSGRRAGSRRQAAAG